MPIIRSIYSSCLQRGITGHTDWTYAKGIFDGFTTALPPNTRVLVAPAVDLDVNTEDENNGGPTYAAVSAGSYHAGSVNSLFCDGSAHSSRIRSTGRLGERSAPSPRVRSAAATPTEFTSDLLLAGNVVKRSVDDRAAGTARTDQSPAQPGW